MDMFSPLSTFPLRQVYALHCAPAALVWPGSLRPLFDSCRTCRFLDRPAPPSRQPCAEVWSGTAPRGSYCFTWACLVTARRMLRRAVGACAGALQLSNQASCSGCGTALAGLCTAAQRFAHGDETIEQIRARIFGNHIGNGLRSGRKVLRRKLVGDKVASYYPEPIERLDRMWEDPSEQECALLWSCPARATSFQAWCKEPGCALAGGWTSWTACTGGTRGHQRRAMASAQVKRSRLRLGRGLQLRNKLAECSFCCPLLRDFLGQCHSSQLQSAEACRERL